MIRHVRDAVLLTGWVLAGCGTSDRPEAAPLDSSPACLGMACADATVPACQPDGRCLPPETPTNCAVDCAGSTPDAGAIDAACTGDCADPAEDAGSADCEVDCATPDAGLREAPPGPDTNAPFPIDRGAESAETPGTYKGLPLRLFDTGGPQVTPVRGVIGVICIGMSNSYRECNHYTQTYFPRGTPDDSINPAIKVANCAVGGSAIERWNSGDDKTWDPCLIGEAGRPSKIQQAGFEIDQVRVIYHKAANQFTADPNDPDRPLPAYPDPGSDYQNFYDNLDVFADKAIDKLPSLQAVYTSSRIYGGYATRPSRNEPLTYEEGHALNAWLTDRIGVTGLRGGVWFGWGPYLWGGACPAGETSGGPYANRADVCYAREDLASDGMHPGPGAQEKVTRMLHDTLSGAAWYRAR